MAFCPYCGSQVDDGSKFCIACGAKLSPAEPAAPAAPQQPAYEAPQEPVYEAPQQPVYEAPQQTYQAPPQQTYQQPQQQYQQPGYNAQQQPYQPQQQSYVPPTQTAYQPQGGYAAAPRKKSKLPLIIGIILGVIVLAVAALLLLKDKLGGGSSDDPTLGVYNCTTVSMSGITLTPEEAFDGASSLTLRKNGKGQIDLGGTKSSIKWTLDGTKLTVEFEKEQSLGTLQDGTITLDLAGTGLMATFLKEGYTPADNSNKAQQPDPAPLAPTASDAGFYAFDSAVGTDDSELGIDGLDLKEDGTGAMVMGNYGIPLTWKTGEILLNPDENEEPDPLPYTVEDDKLIIAYGPERVTFVRSADGAPDYTLLDENFFGSIDPEIDPDPDPFSALSTPSDYWNGEWYGWWMIDTASGVWEEYEGNWWDCVAVISFDEDGTGEIEIWDEDGSRDQLMIYSTLSLGDGTTENGAVMSEDGVFWDDEIGHADWIIDPGASVVSDFDHMIEITGTYTDPENAGSSFDYAIYLRPWGMDWEDVREDQPDNLPYYYDDWYLPLIQSGKTLPDTIG